MSIKEQADNHVGHKFEIDEDSVITICRDSFIQGANFVVNEIQSILEELHTQGTSLFAWGYIHDKLKELKKDGKD